MKNEYEVIGEFLSPYQTMEKSIAMVILKDERGICVMTKDDWNRLYQIDRQKH